MTRTEFKLFAAWEYELEELWLNHMETQGWHLQKIYMGMIYRFEKGEPNQYQYRLEMIDKENGEEYIRFMEEAGIEKIGGYLWWVYFRKQNDGTDFKLFSDVRSRMVHLTRIYNMMNMLRILLIVLLSINYLMAFVAAWLGDRGALVSMFGLIPCVLVAVWLWGGCKSLSYKLQDLQQEQKIHE